jgi:hypothetical protein
LQIDQIRSRVLCRFIFSLDLVCFVHEGICQQKKIVEAKYMSDWIVAISSVTIWFSLWCRFVQYKKRRHYF